MTERFMVDDAGELIDLNNHKFINYGEECCNLLNELHDECEFLKIDNEALEHGATKYAELSHQSLKENEQLKQDRNALIHLLENQSMIIEELHSILLAYQVKEPIVLTKEDLNLMGKAISYYTHGRYGE